MNINESKAEIITLYKLLTKEQVKLHEVMFYNEYFLDSNCIVIKYKVESIINFAYKIKEECEKIIEGI